MPRCILLVPTLCLFALCAQGSEPRSDSKEILNRFLESTRNKDPYVRSTASFDLSAIDVRAHAEQLVPPIVRSLRDPDQTVRRNAAWVAEQLGPLAKDAVPGLIEMLEEDEISSRVNASSALSTIGADAKKAIPALIKATGDKHSAVRANACYGLGRIGIASEECLSALLARSDDPESSVRHAVVHALWALNSSTQQVRECVCKRIKDAAPAIRRDAIWAGRALKLDANAFLPALKDAIQDSEFDVRDIAGLVLTDFGEKSLPVLIEMASHRITDVRVRAVWAIGHMHAKGKAATSKVLELLKKDPEARVRSQSAAALGAIGESLDEVVPALKNALKDNDKHVRTRAQEALDLIDSRKTPPEKK